ncbi:MAG TPA: PaaX family transcriptional regulator C-terminal domain-containing protein, partial [Terrimesophilobacter sp.]|nr:PaaX family transcriptional regulator C-terminal domain-containing protein [Terrimesophilobacter sp.]
LDELELRPSATLFMTGTPRTHGTLAEAAASWWDLDRIAELHQVFLVETAHTLPPPGSTISEADAFARYVSAVDEWRILPYVDPGLPASMLPAGWPGHTAVARFDEIRARLEAPARAFVGL